MKNVTKYLLMTSVGLLFFSACSMGDKGTENTSDSVTIDTNIENQTAVPPKESDTSLIDSLQTDTTGMKR